MDTSTTSCFADVRATVLRQHAELRALLRDLDSTGWPPASARIEEVQLRVALYRLAALFEAHLAFEDLELAPRIRDVDPWGPTREALMRAEHAEQRELLREIRAAAEADPPSSGIQLAGDASRLVVTLLEDLRKEEHDLAELEHIEVYGDDQMTG